MPPIGREAPRSLSTPNEQPIHKQSTKESLNESSKIQQPTNNSFIQIRPPSPILQSIIQNPSSVQLASNKEKAKIKTTNNSCFTKTIDYSTVIDDDIDDDSELFDDDIEIESDNI